jgi:hypothetical protein
MRRSHSSAVYCLPSQRTFELITHLLPTKSPGAPHLHRATTEEPRSQAVATPFCVSGLNPGDIGPAPCARSLAGGMAQGFVFAAGTRRCALCEPFSRSVKASYAHPGHTRLALPCLSHERRQEYVAAERAGGVRQRLPEARPERALDELSAVGDHAAQSGKRRPRSRAVATPSAIGVGTQETPEAHCVIVPRRATRFMRSRPRKRVT